MRLSGQLNSSFATDQHPETYFQGNSLLLSITLCGPILLPTCPRCPAFIPNPSHPKQLWWPRLHSSSTSSSSHSVFNPLQTKPALAPPTPSHTPHVTGRPDQLSGRLAALPLSLPVLAGASPGQLSGLSLEASGAPTQRVKQVLAQLDVEEDTFFPSSACGLRTQENQKPHCCDIFLTNKRMSSAV